MGLLRPGQGRPGQVHGRRTRQRHAPGQPVIEEQAYAKQPAGPHAGAVWQDETQRLHKMRGDLQKHFALAQSFTNQPEFVIFQITQTTMDQLRGSRRCALRQITHLGQPGAQAPAGGIPRNTASIDTPANDEKIIAGHGQRLEFAWRKMGWMEQLRFVPFETPAAAGPAAHAVETAGKNV